MILPHWFLTDPMVTTDIKKLMSYVGMKQYFDKSYYW